MDCCLRGMEAERSAVRWRWAESSIYMQLCDVREGRDSSGG